jgi:hypothetical protein
MSSSDSSSNNNQSNDNSKNVPAVAEADVVASHRAIFNQKAFTLNPDLNVDTEPSFNSRHLTPSKYKRICQVLQKWGPMDDDGNYMKLSDITGEELREEVTKFRAKHQNEYKWAKHYRLESYVEPSTGQQKERLYRVSADGKKRVAVPMNQVFDIISDAHNIKTSHAGRDNTYGSIKESFYNISQDDVALFIKTCPACVRKNVTVKKLPGAKKPIKSSNYRDRFQLDLIDMRSNPQKCVLGKVRRWILSCKDHFTKLCWLDALPRKRPKYVADACHRHFVMQMN